MWDLKNKECFQKIKLKEYVTDFLLVNLEYLLIATAHPSEPISVFTPKSASRGSKGSTRRTSKKESNNRSLKQIDSPSSTSSPLSSQSFQSSNPSPRSGHSSSSGESQPLLQKEKKGCQCCTIL